MSLFCYRCNTTDKGITHEPNVATLIVLSFLAQSKFYSINTEGEILGVRIREETVLYEVSFLWQVQVIKTMAAMLDDKKNVANNNSFVNGYPKWR